jgi:predicted permease
MLAMPPIWAFVAGLAVQQLGLAYAPLVNATRFEGATPAMVTTLFLADRFRLDHDAAALLIGWSTILFWLTLPLALAVGLVG